MKEQYSFTKIDTFNQFQYKYRLKYINKIPEDLNNNLAIQKGSLVHMILERKINNETDMQDPELVELLLKLAKEDVSKILKSLKKFVNGRFFKDLDIQNGIAETYFHLNKNLHPCLKPDSFISGKIDYYEKRDDYVLIIDWKTGKKTLKDIQLYKTDTLQLDIYALWVLQKFDEIENTHTMFY